MRINKKVIITAVIVAVVAICGIIVYSVGYTPKMLVGGIYNGISLRTVTDHSDDYAEYDIHNALDAEKQIAKNTTVLISAMKLVSENAGTVTLKIVSPNIKNILDNMTDTITATDKDGFMLSLDEYLTELFKKEPQQERTEPILVDVDMKYEAGAWVIIPSKELFDAVTGSFAELADGLYQKLCN